MRALAQTIANRLDLDQAFRSVVNRHRKTPYDFSKPDSTIRELLAPFHQRKEHPLPRADDVVRRLRAIPAFRDVRFEGCTAEEIANLEARFQVRLPASYKEFLARLGRGAGSFLASDHWLFQYDDVPRFARDEGHAEHCELPRDYFVFAQRDGYAWTYFIADGTSNDPPVFLFDDGPEKSPEWIARSIWEFIETLVIDYEIWSDMGLLRPTS